MSSSGSPARNLQARPFGPEADHIYDDLGAICCPPDDCDFKQSYIGTGMDNFVRHDNQVEPLQENFGELVPPETLLSTRPPHRKNAPTMYEEV